MRVAWGLEEGQEGPIPNRGSHRAPAWGWIILTVGVGEGVEHFNLSHVPQARLGRERALRVGWGGGGREG